MVTGGIQSDPGRGQSPWGEKPEDGQSPLRERSGRGEDDGEVTEDGTVVTEGSQADQNELNTAVLFNNELDVDQCQDMVTPCEYTSMKVSPLNRLTCMLLFVRRYCVCIDDDSSSSLGLRVKQFVLDSGHITDLKKKKGHVVVVSLL